MHRSVCFYYIFMRFKTPMSDKADPVHTMNTGDTAPDGHALWLKEALLRWICAIGGSISLYGLVAAIIEKSYHPSIAGSMAKAQQLLVSGTANVLPEPMEAMLFRAGIVTLFLGMLLCYGLVYKSKWVDRFAKTSWYWPVSVISVLAIITLFYSGFAALNPFPDEPQPGHPMVGQTNYDYYFGSLFLGGHIWLYALLIFPAVCYLFFALKKYGLEHKKAYRRVSAITGYTFVAAIIIAIIIINTFSFPYSWQQKNDFTAVYYSLTQVYAGVPMLADHFTNTYGLYPHFLAPLFKLIGLSVVKFSLVMSLLLAVAFVFNLLFLRQFVRNRVILFLGFFTMVLFSYLGPRILGPYDSIFAFFPIRYIFPSLLALIAGTYFRKGSVKIYWLTFFLVTCAIIWNPEMGLVSFGSWLLANTYHDWYDKKGIAQPKKILRHWLVAVGMVLVVFYGWKLLIYCCYGVWPEMGLLFSAMSIFENIGFNLLPMSLLHPWNMTALILCLGFLYAIVRWFKKDVTPRATIILLVSFIGVGYFFYFQGRSHKWNFAASSGFCILLLTLLGDELWQLVKTTNDIAINGLFILFIFIVSYSLPETLLNADKIYADFYQQPEKDAQQLEQQMYEGNREFFLHKTTDYQVLHLLSSRKYPGLYLDSKRINATNPGLEDLFLLSDLRRLERSLRDDPYDVFIEPYNLGHMPYLKRSLAIIGATYEYTDVHETMYQLEKRKTPMPAQTFFAGTNADVFHRKYSDDTTGVEMRIQDGQGVGAVTLNSEFSVQVLFYPGVQMFPYATIIGNNADNNGFVLSKVLYSPNYLFAVNGKSVTFSVPFYQWDYCVINVYPNHIDIYQNGSFVSSFPVDGPMRQSFGQLCIGNINGQHYLIGPISEVALANKAVDSTSIRQTWQAITQNIKVQ